MSTLSFSAPSPVSSLLSKTNRHCFFNYHRSRHRFSFTTDCCKPIIWHLFQMCYRKLFQCFLLDAINDHNWSFVSLYCR